VLYAGDDVTDETVFTTLGPADVGIKVGAGATAAAHRIAGPPAVRTLLRALAKLITLSGPTSTSRGIEPTGSATPPA
jgi:trehalose 6-phosphate phosphatase